jgi:protocatechuate 4,5-dioxygenase beta chain
MNKDFDLMCLEKIVSDPLALARYTIYDFVRLAGTQGVEIISWLVARGALDEHVKKVHSHYHLPVSNTAAGLMVLENAA